MMMESDPPVPSLLPAAIETPRLRLRPLAMADAEELNAIQSDPHHMRFYPHPFSLQESREWIERMRERAERDGFALLAVEDRETGEFLGNVGPILQHVDDVDEVELGWSITPTRARQGIATEAAFACRDWVFATLADRPRHLADPAGEHAVTRRGREPRDDGVEAGSVGDAEAADPSGVPVGPSGGLTRQSSSSSRSRPATANPIAR